MRKLLTDLTRELEAGRAAMLCTVTDSRGSVPRGTGARMLVLEGGEALGTIGGGAVEHQAVQFARELLEQGRSAERTYGLAPGGDADMICGGEVDVRFRCLAPSDVRELEAIAREWAPADRVLLFGGGHVARALAKVLSLADYSVEVWDQRPEAVTPALFPDAAALRCGAWEAALEALAPVAAEDYVVVMTPGHQGDFTVLAQVLKTPAKYIGCIGSRSKAAAVRSRLLEAGFSEGEVDRVRSPIGLPVGGKAPGEIAVSVAAEMIACRYGSPIERSRYASN
ncbi:MAG: xanthine dehydrogenase accessory protein XdhC [Oscillospiraceae bacterium]|jgi:xanthine dehydrogenase accessory factor|nr:xanthine dehydrogenase accessory protein XdhC [Oscillospiraceae bacterium]